MTCTGCGQVDTNTIAEDWWRRNGDEQGETWHSAVEDIRKGALTSKPVAGGSASTAESCASLGPTWWLICAVWIAVVATAVFAACPAAHAESYSSTDVHNWISAYASKYATPGFPYADLVARSERVARCESDHFDVAVINDARRGLLGEVGVFQFMPGPRSIFWLTPSAAAGWDYWDAEANVAGAVWLISRGYGPRNWSCW